MLKVSRGTSSRIRGRRLQHMRAELFTHSPLCAECKRNNRIALATQRDHITPLFMDGQDIDSNTQGLCDDCHDKKSRREQIGYDKGCEVDGLPIDAAHHWNKVE